MAEQFDFLKTIQDETNLINSDQEKESMHIINDDDTKNYTIDNIDKLDIHSIAGDELVNNIFSNAYKTFSTMEEYIDNDNLSKNQLKIQSKNLFSLLDQYNMLTCYMSIDKSSQERAFNHDFSRMSPVEAREGNYYKINSIKFRLRDELSTGNARTSCNKYMTLLRDAYLIDDAESNSVSLVDISNSERFDELNSDSIASEFDSLTTYELGFKRVYHLRGGGFGEGDWDSRTQKAEAHLLNLIYEYGSNANDFKLDESSLFDSVYSTISENAISIKEPVIAEYYSDVEFDAQEIDEYENDENDSNDFEEVEESEEDQLLNNEALRNRARRTIDNFDTFNRERQLEILRIFQYTEELNSENEG